MTNLFFWVRLLGCALFSIIFAGCSVQHEVDVDLVSCLHSLTNVSEFATTPLGKAGMISTYDPTGGNRDWGNFTQRKKDGTVVIADLKGPGCVTRIWKTAIPNCQWRFFFDGERHPRIEADNRGVFGGMAPFVPPLCDQISTGEYCYMPIPYAKSLRIELVVPEVSKDARPYYQINYETFSRDVVVRSFPKRISSNEQLLLQEVRDCWKHVGIGASQLESKAIDSAKRLELASGQTAVWMEQQGSGCLSSFRFAVDPNSKLTSSQRVRVLREVVLRIYWDDSAEASVEAPLGDFFCNGLYWRPFSSLPISSSGKSLECRFPMPFAKSMRAELSNEGGLVVDVDVSTELTECLDTANINYFHARWAQSVSSGRPFYTLYAAGSGHYVGCYLIALGMDGGWNILEGDEVFRVDGEASPSLHGTGLEDYFNGAWYYSGLFDLPLHGLLEKEAMRTAQYRFHLSDPVSFDKKLLVSFEFGDANRARGYMSAVSYWYQPEPHGSGSQLATAAERIPALDKVGAAAIMTGLCELERAGLVEQARERCLILADKFGASEIGNILRLRAVAYQEALDGDEKVLSQYQKWAEVSGDSSVGRQARALAKVYRESDMALLTAHINGAFKLYLDGTPVLHGDSPADLFAAGVRLTPGKHVIAAEVLWNRPDNWFMTTLCGKLVNIWADRSWLTSPVAMDGWKDIGYDDSGWTSAKTRWYLPKMAWFYFRPNAFILTQHREVMGSGYKDGNASGRTTFFRKEFYIVD